MEGLTPNCGVNWSPTEESLGRSCKIPPLKGLASVQTLRKQSFHVSGPRLFNYIPKSIRNLKNCDLSVFKEMFYLFLVKVPDEPKTRSLTPGATNTLTGKHYLPSGQKERHLVQYCLVRPIWILTDYQREQSSDCCICA